MDAIDRVKACLLRHPDWDAARIQRSCSGSTRNMVANLKSTMVVPEGQSVPSVVALKPSLLSLDKVKDRYDVVGAIQREVLNIPRGKLLLDEDMCRLTAGKDRNRFRKAVENNQEIFKPYRIKINLEHGGEGKFYWGHKDDVAEVVRLKDEI